MLYLNPGTNYTPWLFLDGTSAGSSYSNWQSLILSRAAVPAPIVARMWGSYNPQTRTGTVYAWFWSETTATLQVRVLFVITEDSIFYQAPNGDNLHNHVARDYIPDHIGTLVELRPGDTITVSYPFSLASNWVMEKCEIVAIIQNSIAINNVREIFQGAKIKIRDLPTAGVEEVVDFSRSFVKPQSSIIKSNIAEFLINLPANTNYILQVVNVSGQPIISHTGVSRGNEELIRLNLPKNLSSGLYFYRLELNPKFPLDVQGKFIILN
ncbi:MAG: Omp28-related outer membrane protein [candidate division WOR-3 bacterium]